MKMDRVEFYTDGSGSASGGKAGWAFAYQANGKWVVVYGPGEVSGTNNSAEWSAIVVCLHSIIQNKLATKVQINTDADDCVKTFNDWLPTWTKTGTGYLKRDGKPAKNPTLIKAIDDLRPFLDFTFKHVRAHSGIPGHELVDRYAKAGREATGTQVITL
jgi:ribonuclease HI